MEIVKLLIKNDSNPNAQNNDGETSLHFACLNNNIDIVKLLIKHSSNIYYTFNSKSYATINDKFYIEISSKILF